MSPYLAEEKISAGIFAFLIYSQF